jgi:RNA methyltransferase, TrmH family
MKIIESRHNPEVKGIVALHDRKNRSLRKLYIAQGLRTCTALIQSGQKLKNLYVTYRMLDQARDLVGEANVTVVHDEVMEKISTTDSPSGMLGVFVQPEQAAAQTISSGVVLARITDPGNMGTLIRSCAAMGHKTVIVVEGTDAWSPKVVQASAGTLGMVNVISMNWEDLLIAKQNTPLCALVVNGGKKPTEIDLASMLLVVGNEAQGIPSQWIADCDIKLTLPMPGNAESLNAAIAGSIALYLAAVE